MPAPKKAGSARRSPATNKDGSVRKRPGPAKGTPRGQKSVAPAANATKVDTGTDTPKPRAKRGTAKKKTFLIYAVDGHELSFATEHPGATGQIAVAAAVKAGVLAPDTPYVFLTPATVARAVEIEAVERDVQYKVKAVAKRRATRKPKVEPEPTPEPDVAPAPSVTVKAPSARGGKKSATQPAEPPATTANPFA